MKTAFLCFFPVFPTTMGSAEVIRSLFLCWPGNKKLFQGHFVMCNYNNKRMFTLYFDWEICPKSVGEDIEVD